MQPGSMIRSFTLAASLMVASLMLAACGQSDKDRAVKAGAAGEREPPGRMT